LKDIKKIVVGIIGYGGRIGKIHTRNIIFNFPEVKVKYACDINIEEIKDWAYGLGITKVTKNHEELLKDDEVSSVFICSPTPTHVDYIIQAANAGKDIFCEKPIDLDPEKIKKALNVIKKNNVILQVGFMKRFDKNFIKLKELINNGEVGSLYLIKITSRDPFFPPLEYLKASGGLFLDMTCHDFDLLRYLIGNEIEEVFAIGRVFKEPRLKGFNDFDTAVINLNFRNEVLGIIENSRGTNYGYDQRIELFGSRGCITVSNPRLSQISFSKEEKIVNENPYYWFIERYTNSYINEIKYFFEVIKNNKEPIVTGLDSLKALLIGLAAKRSAEENKPIKINYKI
jgi:myo-inositol 2-dehydrogenase/D-chiro-inositol 1-dehydrogenase